MPILVDGSNLLHRLVGGRSRASVRKLVLDATRHERISVVVVFDGPPPVGLADHESLGQVTVVYSGPVSADDLIISRIPGGRAASQWTVVTDDRGLADRARQQGASTRTLKEWTARPRRTSTRPRTEPKLSSRELSEWEDFFGLRGEDDS